MNYKFSIFDKKTIGHILFWLIILIYHISSAWPHEANKLFLAERMISKTITQIILSYVILYMLIPLIREKKRRLQFAVFGMLAVYGAYVLHTAIRCFYLLPKYPEVYSYRPPLVFFERITNVYAFIGNITDLTFAAIILIVIDYYRKQKEIVSLQEQKRTTELNLLKHQLNPHFLFNTLNNLYTLALKKSDKTPEVIEKLSEILDYILYRCEARYVPLRSEIKLIENYIALEKIRYGKRVDVNFDCKITEEAKIAPLLLLTLLENAFKHGVSQEINSAFINIKIEANKSNITVNIENSKPENNQKITAKQRSTIGLTNIQKQLQLLYPKEHVLSVIDEKKRYESKLILSNHVL